MITIIFPFTGKATVSGTYAGWSNNSGNSDINYSIEVYFGTPSSDDAIDVKWDAATKTGTFEMPAFDVEIAPIYAPTAVFDTKDDLVLIPTAIEGIYAESTDAIVKAGTVAKIGETENEQGTLMYAVGTSATEQPALTAFSATLPTAKDITAAGDVYVWYYIKGADTPQEQTATAENTFNDSEICATPLKVTVLNNKFDIQFTAANDNTIEAGKATVTVDGAAATVTEGKLEGVKMGSEVKLKANTGYKFRKVEVKKGAGSLIVNPVVGQVIGSDGKNYAADATLTDGVTPVAMIAYVSGSHGLAIALADEGANLWVPWMYWDTAVTTAAAHTPAITGGTWKLPSQDEWKQMFSANGGNEDSYTGLNTALSTAGGNILTESGTYWSSSEVGENASKVYFNSGNTSWSQEGKNEAYSVRACLAF
jgi:hypothetical protein